MTNREICSLIQNAEREAGRLMREAHGVIAESKTGSRDVVTEYDRKVQLLLETRIREALPDAKFFCEELGERGDLEAEHVFIIDPIDGTMNFVHGLNCSCISVAYRSKGVLSAGVIYNPYADEMFSAVLGEGADVNGRPLRMDDAPLCEGVSLVGTSPYIPAFTHRTFEIAEKLFNATLDIRRDGAAAVDLCLVAAGRAVVYVELSLCLWDYAAGMLIVSEAGGVCLTEDGKELPFDGERSSMLAGTKKAVREYLEIR